MRFFRWVFRHFRLLLAKVFWPAKLRVLLHRSYLRLKPHVTKGFMCALFGVFQSTFSSGKTGRKYWKKEKKFGPPIYKLKRSAPYQPCFMLLLRLFRQYVITTSTVSFLSTSLSYESMLSTRLIFPIFLLYSSDLYI